MNFQIFKLDLEKPEEPEIKLPTSVGLPKKQESSRKTSISALLIMPKPLTVWITTNWKILQEMGISDHLTCLLRNLYSGQEATVRTGHGTTDWFQIRTGVCQGCILSPCLFNLCAGYIMRNAGSIKHRLESTLLTGYTSIQNCSMSGSNCCLLTHTWVSQEADKVVWYSHLLKNFPVCCDPHSQRL